MNRSTRRSRRSALLALGCAPVAVLLHAAGLGGVASAQAAVDRPAGAEEGLAGEVQRLLPGAREIGRTSLRWFGLPIYDAQLWSREVVTALDFAQREFVLSLRYARSLEGAAIAERSLDEMRRQQPLAPALAAAWLAQMKLAFPDVRAGDRLIGWHQPGRSTRFFHNGQARGELADAAFGARFFGIWLSPQSSQPALRQALLGETP